MIHKISPLPGYDGVGSPRWSPDGKRLAYDSRGDGRYRIILADLNTGDRHVLTTEPMDGARPSWSRDGRWVYFSSTREGSRQIWEAPAGGGQAIRVTKNGGFEAFESSDGRALYYIRSPEDRGLWRTRPDRGRETLVCEAMMEGTRAVSREMVYFVNPAYVEKASKALKNCDPATGREASIMDLDKGAGLDRGLSISAAGRILY